MEQCACPSTLRENKHGDPRTDHPWSCWSALSSSGCKPLNTVPGAPVGATTAAGSLRCGQACATCGCCCCR
eukprot:5912500-Prorocentrum_lima.AAC.1